MQTHHQTTSALCAALFVGITTAQAAAAQAGSPQLGTPQIDKEIVRPRLPVLPPKQPDAGGRNVPNVGMHSLLKYATGFGGKLPSTPRLMPVGVVAPNDPAPLGWVLSTVGLYLPDNVDPSIFTAADQAALQAKISMAADQYPEPFELGNTDPSGSLDDSALDAQGNPIHFNLHWPPQEAPSFWLEDEGLDPAAPTDDLAQIIDDILATGNSARVQEGIDILLGTNVSGALTNKVYRGFALIKAFGAVDNQTFDPVTRNIEVTQLWYGTEILSDCQLLEVPEDGDYTITWKLRGLGDTGVDRELAFPIDEFTAIPMKETSNSDFWRVNNWIWKWFNAVQDEDGRKFTLPTFYELHTGTSAAPSYSELVPGDPRYWLHADRKFDMGSYVGQGDLNDTVAFQTYDLDLNGKIGGYLVDGTDTGLPYDGTSNSQAQFNQYGNNEFAVPLASWADGPIHIPYFGLDSSFQTISKGKGIDLTVRYSQGEMQAGLYVWGWRVHPPRINWIETYSDGQILPSGAPKQWRFKHKWDAVAELGLDAIGDFAPEKRLYQAFVDFAQSAAQPSDVAQFQAATQGLMDHIRDRRGLPPTPGVAGFPNPAADVNFLYTNLDIYADRDTMNVAGKGSWEEGDVITITIHNDDNIERYFRVVDFGTTDYQYSGVDMGLFDWKPVFGFPQLAPVGWSPRIGIGYGFGAQGATPDQWLGTALEGIGNPFYIAPTFDDPANFWPAGQRDLIHPFSDLSGFSGPGFTPEIGGVYGVWSNEPLAGLPTGDPNIWRYSYGKPIAPNTTVTFEVEMPRAAALNNGAMYMFDPQFHPSSIFTMHPTSEIKPEGLGN